jgi:hypothetical protein
MHLSQTHAGLGTITLSVPGLSSLSYRWLRAMNWNLLCSCVLDSFNTLDAMTSTRCIRSGSLPQPRPPATCTLPSCTFSICASFRCLQIPSVSQACRGKGENPSMTQLGSPASRAWLYEPSCTISEIITFFTFLSIFSVVVWTKPSQPPVHLLALRKPTGMVCHLWKFPGF